MTTSFYPYLIVGGGMAADAVARGIRQLDQAGQIAIFSREPDPPYNRPPLSKGLWKRTRLERIWRNTAALGSIEICTGREIVQLDPISKKVRTADGSEFSFGKLLLATGGQPVRPWPESPHLVYLRTLQDYYRLRSLTENSRSFLVIGGGFIGSEIAASLAGIGKQVTMVFPESGIGARLLPADLAGHLNQTFSQNGVEVLSGELVASLTDSYQGIKIRLKSGREMHFDAAVAGLGIQPETGLAVAAQLPVGVGIQVNALLQTSYPEIYAAGDVIEFHNPQLNRRMRVEHEEHANLSGLAAGRNMAGANEPYTLLPYFYSDLFDISYQAVGEIDLTHEVIARWEELYQKGIIYYIRSGELRGAVLWNLPFQQLEAVRAKIGTPFDPGR